jgi:hypothetical protein
MKIEIVVEKTDAGFQATAKKYSITANGKSIEELQSNMLETLNYYFQHDNITVSKSNLRLLMNFKHFFKHYRVLNAKFLAARIGMNPTLLSQYIIGHKTPSADQARKIY